MERMKQKLGKLNKVCVIIACIHWLLSFFTDRLIFSYVAFDFHETILALKSIVMLLAKFGFLPVLIVFWQVVYWLVKKADRRFVRFFVIYGAIQIMLLLLTWPGIWRIDEFGILSSACKLLPVFWQNYITSVFYIYALMLVPVPAGVIMAQMFVNSLIAAYIASHTEQLLWERTSKWGYLLLLPFLFFPVLDSNLYPMRMSVYAFLELYVLFLLFELFEAKKHMAAAKRPQMTEAVCGKGADITKLVQVALFGAIVAVWRTEGIYYLVMLPILITIIFWNDRKRAWFRNVVISFCALTLLLFGVQAVGGRLTSGNSYDLTSVVLPVVPLIERAYEEDSAEAEQLLAQIDKVLSVEEAYKGVKAGKNGISLFWSNEKFIRDYTNEEYAAFKHAFYQLVLRYPGTFLKERMTCFAESTTLLDNTTELFTKEGNQNYDTFRTYPLSGPIHNETRTSVIKMLELRSAEDYNKTLTAYGIVYSHIIPIVLLVAAIIICLVKKRGIYSLLLLAPCCKVPLIFLTAPSRLFMYYYSVYLIGWVVAIYGVTAFVCKRRRMRHE